MRSSENNHKRATGYGNIASGIFVALVLAAGGGVMASTAFVSPSYAQTDSAPNTTNGNSTTVGLGGQISSVQMGDNETAGWEQSGFWVLRTQFQNNTTPESAEDIEWSQFVARFDMYRPDGSELHSHDIYGFDLVSYQVEEVGEDMTLSFSGNATVTMPDEVIEQVSTIIQIEGNSNIQISLGGDVEGHFGEQPLNGTLSDISMDKVGRITGQEVGDGTTNGNATNNLLQLTTDKQEYERGETVTFTAENLGSETLTFSDAALGIEIRNTDTDETHNIIAAEVLTLIAGGESVQVEWEQEGEGAEAGNYVASIITVEGTPPSASAEVSFSIVEQ